MNKKKGFSLVELLVVMAIMAIIVLLATPKYLNYTKEAKSKQILADIKTTSNKLAVFMASNDNLPGSSTEINTSTLAFYVDDKKMYDLNGVVTSIDDEISYSILPSTFIKRETGSKLNGQFVATAGGDVYYIDEDSSTATAAISTPSIMFSTTSDPEQMLVTINYPKNSVIQEYKIDDGEWQTATIETAKSVHPFVQSIAASESGLIANITTAIESTVYARAIYENNKSYVKKSNVCKLEITPLTTDKVKTLTVNIDYPAGTHIKEYKIGNGDWELYTTPITIDYNTIIYAKGVGANNSLVYGKITISNIENDIEPGTDSEEIYERTNGLLGKYYNGTNFNTFVLERIDSLINFNWGTKSPATGVKTDSFSIKWTGYVYASDTGLYDFRTIVDDGIKLWVNNELIINRWSAGNSITNYGKINLEAGKWYPIEMHYYEGSIDAVIRLAWKTPGTTSYVTVPSHALSIN